MSIEKHKIYIERNIKFDISKVYIHKDILLKNIKVKKDIPSRDIYVT